MFDIYKATEDNLSRYTIGKLGSNMLFVIGTIPSTSTSTTSDQSTTCVSNISSKHGYDGFVLVNLYPVRKLNFQEPFDVEEKQNNINEIQEVLRNYPKCNTIWAAWGDNIDRNEEYRLMLKEIYSSIKAEAFNWVCFGGITSNGNPKSPIGNSYSNSFEKFDIKRYCYIS